MVSTIAIIFAVVFLIVGVTTVYKGKASQTFTFAVSILVAFVPEGLPSTVTLLYVHRIHLFFRHLRSIKAFYCRKAHGFSERSSQGSTRSGNVGYVSPLSSFTPAAYDRYRLGGFSKT
jgi:hypothetical protein